MDGGRPAGDTRTGRDSMSSPVEVSLFKEYTL